jgi:hypothetical protein
MSELTERINYFILKQKGKVRLTHEEAQKLGIEKPQVNQPTKPKIPRVANEVNKLPKVPSSTKQPPKMKLGGGSRTNRFTGIPGEVARQIAPKNPYSSPYDIAADVNEATRIGGAVGNLFKPKK